MKDALETFIDESIRVSSKNGYHPTEFIRMRQRHGTKGAISRLVRSGEIQTGFNRLFKLGLIDWTIESAVLKFPHAFTKEDIECARFRLEQVEQV